jgi:hypothetical protein
MPNMMVERIEDLELPWERASKELRNGDIILFQRKLDGNEGYRVPTCSNFFWNLTVKKISIFF